MVMNVNNLRELVKKAANDNAKEVALFTCFDFLMNERIKLTQNSLRSLLGRPEKQLNREAILQSVKRINEIAAKYAVDFHINEDWENVEAFLRMSILEDVAGEFQKQEN